MEVLAETNKLTYPNHMYKFQFCFIKYMNEDFCLIGTTTTTPAGICQSYEVQWDNHCYYLDGSTGNCATGYALAPNAILATIAPQFVGKDYRSTVSGNCCIWTADTYEQFGFTYDRCNVPGPFTTGPVLGGAGCTNAQNHYNNQLTFCGTT